MSRSIVTLVFSALLLASTAFAKGGANDRPNILWILSDDHSPMLGAYGDEFATTPNLDALAEEGVIFSHAYSNAPVCAPARATLITGLYPTSTGMENMRSVVQMPASVTYFSAHMRKAGYYTVNMGKHDFNMLPPADAWHEFNMDKRMQDWDRSKYFAETSGDKPFFTIINLTNAHESRVMNDFKGNKRDLSKTQHDPAKVPLPAYYPDTKLVRQTMAQYYDNVTEVDGVVANILKNLKADGLDDNTIVIFFADHGNGVPRSKRTPSNSGLQVPLIVRVPEKYRHLAPGRKGSTNDEMVSFVDFAPTMLSLAGAKVPSVMQGRIFMGKGKQKAPKYTHGFRARMDERLDLVRTTTDGRFQYVRNFYPHLPAGQYVNTQYKIHPIMQEWHKGLAEARLNADQASFFMIRKGEELYDLKSDPSEVHNLAGNPKFKKTLLRLRRATSDWMTEVKDVGLLTEAEMFRLSKEANASIYDVVRRKGFDHAVVQEAASRASFGEAGDRQYFVDLFADENQTLRYWGVMGLLNLADASVESRQLFKSALKDENAIVAIAAAEALCRLDDCDQALDVLVDALDSAGGAQRVMAVNVLDRLDDRAQPKLVALEALAAKLAPIEAKSSYDKLAKPGTERALLELMFVEYTRRVLGKALRDLKHDHSFEVKRFQ